MKLPVTIDDYLLAGLLGHGPLYGPVRPGWREWHHDGEAEWWYLPQEGEGQDTGRRRVTMGGGPWSAWWRSSPSILDVGAPPAYGETGLTWAAAAAAADNDIIRWRNPEKAANEAHKAAGEARASAQQMSLFV